MSDFSRDKLRDYYQCRVCSLVFLPHSSYPRKMKKKVVEHLHDSEKELDRLWQCLEQGGRLGIMTQFVVERSVFHRWHYKNDLTHVRFFSRETFSRLARTWNADLAFPESDVAIFYKRPGTGIMQRIHNLYFIIQAL